MSTDTGEKGERVIIEQLTFQVERDRLADWLAADAEVWDPVLAALPGYLGKEVWVTEPVADVSLASPVDVQVIVRWTDLQTWKSAPQELLDATHRAMGVHALSCRETVHVRVGAPPS